MYKKTITLLPHTRFEAVAFIVGLVILSFELVAARIVAPYLGDTVYTWTSIIGVILAAMAVGYSLGGYYADLRKRTEDIIVLLLMAAAAIAVISLVKDSLLASVSMTKWPLQLQALSASLLLFAAPTLLLGAVSPYLARLSIVELSTSGRKLSGISAAGTFGSLAGTFLTGYVLFGLFGSQLLITLLALTLVATTLLLSSSFAERLPPDLSSAAS